MRFFIISLTLQSVLGTTQRHVLLERGIPSGWNRLETVVPTNHTFTMDIPLVLKDEGKSILAAATSRSNPSSPFYGQWLTKNEINDLLDPIPGTFSAVHAWLNSCQVPRTTIVQHASAFKIVHVSKDTILCLLQAELSHFVRISDGFIHIAVHGQLSIPYNLRKMISFIPGLVDFPLPSKLNVSKKNKKKKRTKVDRVDKGIVAPKTIQALYNIPNSWYNTTSLSKTTLLVAEFLSETSYIPAFVFGDKSTKEPGFFKEAGLNTPIGGADAVKIVGTFKPDGGELEAELDIQYSASTARGVSLVYWTTAAWMYEFTTNLFAGKNGVDGSNVDVVSISFTWSEAKECTTPSGTANPTCTALKVQSKEYVERVNIEFAKLSAMGVSIFVSSGDDGAPGNLGDCTEGNVLDSSYPASSQWVTTVGATMLASSLTSELHSEAYKSHSEDPICKDNNGCATSSHEIACSYPSAGITTGGGFSVFTPRPSWQNKAVSKYLSSGNKFPPR